MNKLKLLVTASLLVGGGIFALSAADGVTSAKAAEDIKTVTYKPNTKTTVVFEGDEIFNSVVSYKNTWDQKGTDPTQVTGNNSLNFSLSNIPSNYYVTNITLNMKRTSKGKGNINISVGDNQIATNETLTLTTSLSDYNYIVDDLNGDINVTINATANSLYCASYSISYYEVVSTHDVLFYDGDILMGKEIVDDGDTVKFINIDTYKEGYVFAGWYEDPIFTIAYNEDTPVTETFDLYAKYVSVNDLTFEQYFEYQKTNTSLKAKQEVISKDVSITFPGTTISFQQLPKDNDNLLPLLGLDNGLWDLEASKNGFGTFPQINKADYIRIYYPVKSVSEKPSITFKIKEHNINSIYINSTGGKLLVEATTDGSEFSEIKINDDGMYHFEKGTIAFRLSNVSEKYINENSDANKDNLDIKNLTINYNGLSVTNTSIRFGTSIPMDKFAKEASYGIILADGAKIAEGADLNKLYNGSSTAADYVTYLKQQNINAYQAAFTSDEIAYVATPNSTVALDETDPTAKYAQFAVVIDGLLEHMDQTFAAVCYMEYEGQLYLMKEARHSINSVVDAYLADEEIMGTLTDNSVAILNALNAM